MNHYVLSYHANSMDVERLENRIKKELAPFQYHITKWDEKDINFLELSLCNRIRRKNEEETIRDRVAKIIVGALVEDNLFLQLLQMIEKKYANLDTNDKNLVLYFTMDHFNKPFKVRRWKQLAYRRALEVLAETNEICLDGFQKFRLKEIVSQMELYVEDGIERLLIEREYEEFICLLRSFIEIQPPLMEEVHITKAVDGYHLTDARLLPIEQLELYQVDMEEELMGMSEDDKLISALIAIAPLRILIHGNSMSAPILDTICTIFQGKVVMVNEPLLQ